MQRHGLRPMRGRIRATILAALCAAALPATVAAQRPGALRVEGVGEPVSVSPAMHHGYVAYPAWTLRALGGRVDGTPAGARVILESDTLEFLAGSPFFMAGGEARQLVDAAYREGGVFYLPHQFFAEWLPRTYANAVAFADAVLRLKGSGAASDAPAPDAPAGNAAGAAPAAGEGAPLGEVASTPLVVIDPGHGGVDPGRIGPTGLKEKDIVLQVSKRLAEVLTARGYEVRLTRTGDTLINLYERGPMANEWRGPRPGLFLSIHANGVWDRRANGFETFFLSDARTDDERRVAEMENAAAAYHESTHSAGTEDLDLIMNSLRNDFYVRSSHELATLVQDEFTEFHRGANRGVKQGGFIVLIGAFMPAVLIELGFVSNPTEERLLGSGRFQVRSAEAIADAVDRFFEAHRDWTGPTR